MPPVLLVAVGGVMGSLARYGLVVALPDLAITLAINAVGALLLGVLVARAPEGHWSRSLVGTGVLGGFTTMSAVAVEQAPYVAATFAVGIVAAALGARVAR